MEALIIAETVFYIVVSLAIIALGLFLTIMAYEIVKIAKNLRAISDNLSSISKDTEAKIREIIQKLSDLPILSFFMNKEPRKAANPKGRSSNSK